MAISSIQEKIQKLLALGRGKANESESMQALNLAMRLMAEHGISEDQLRSPEQKAEIIESVKFEYRGVWQPLCAKAASYLFPSDVLIYKRGPLTLMSFIGRADNVLAAQEVMAHLIYQIEYFYKSSMPKGMTQRERATFRKEFKIVAANRIAERCDKIARGKPVTETLTGTDIVIFDHLAKLRSEIDDYIADRKIKSKRTPNISIKDNRAFHLGQIAGDRAELRKAIN